MNRCQRVTVIRQNRGLKLTVVRESLYPVVCPPFEEKEAKNIDKKEVISLFIYMFFQK
jgi:hypothetical protein